MSADVRLAFSKDIPTRYRVPQDARGQCSRDRLGAACDQIKVKVDTEGFAEAMTIAMQRGRIGREDEPLLWERFFLRLAQTMRRGARPDLARSLEERAARALAEASRSC
jgi:hypothetical protein